ncbi:DUF982 domain-containing protein [Phyllobacterium sophorae]|uniref:DUF982 domain-containing protein n=1 Tax=Phyllobacterium sophorae TaxID=1520277 RepID=UPI003CCA4665
MTGDRNKLRIVSSVQDAWKLLAEEWPPGETTLRHKALTICALALRGKAGADVAREVLIVAAKKRAYSHRPCNANC